MERILRFEDDKGNISIVHYNAWLSIIKGILMKYANKTEAESDAIIKSRQHNLFRIPESDMAAGLMSHELEYHWAMLAAYGNMYWLPENGGISASEPADYFDWYDKYIEDNNLKEPFVFIDK